MEIGVVVNYKLKEGQSKAFVEYMQEMIALTKQEKGCIAYDLYEAADGSGEIVMLEIWENQELLDAHIASEHFKRLVPGAEQFMSGDKMIRNYNRK